MILTLKEVLKSEDIQGCVKAEMHFTNQEFTEILEKVLADYKENLISTNCKINDKPYVFENSLHYNKEKEEYLLENRLFDKNKDIMIYAYLEILDKKGEIKRKSDEDYIEDVWEDADWALVL